LAKPFRTSIISGCLITINGDYVSQVFIEKGKHKRNKDSAWYVPDWERTHKMAWTGALIRGP